MRMLRGQCLCGACEYELPDEFEFAQFCHCRNCQRRGGGGYSVFARIAKAKVRWVKGEERLTLFGDAGGYNYFCSACGATLMATLMGDTLAHVQLGTLVDEPSVQPGSHIFVSRKRVWDVIGDGLPQYAGHVHEG